MPGILKRLADTIRRQSSLDQFWNLCSISSPPSKNPNSRREACLEAEDEMARIKKWLPTGDGGEFDAWIAEIESLSQSLQKAIQHLAYSEVGCVCLRGCSQVVR